MTFHTYEITYTQRFDDGVERECTTGNEIKAAKVATVINRAKTQTLKEEPAGSIVCFTSIMMWDDGEHADGLEIQLNESK